MFSLDEEIHVPQMKYPPTIICLASVSARATDNGLIFTYACNTDEHVFALSIRGRVSDKIFGVIIIGVEYY